MASGSERPSAASNDQHVPSRPAIAPLDDPQSTTTAARRTVSDGDILDARWATVKKAAPDRAAVAASRYHKLASGVPSIPAPGQTASRENSPARPAGRANNNTTSPSATRKPSRTRQSSQDRSPNRSTSGQSPGPTTQRVSSQTIARPPVLTSSTSQSTASDTATQDSSPEKTTAPWSAPAAPNIASKRSNPHLAPSDSDSHNKSDSPARERTPTAPRRAGNGTKIALETVQESASDPATPSADLVLEPTSVRKVDTADDGARSQHAESGSDSSGRHKTDNAHDGRRHITTTGTDTGTTTSARHLRAAHTASSEHLAKRSTTSLSGGGAGARSKPADGSVRNMIVETETVSSIPQVSLGVGTGERGSSARVDAGGTLLRMKPSTETIRPRKEKKRTTRKPASLAAGTASSKADIFEAKVASAVDEADVSDSDETFVYESNPPDPYPARQHRYHSRTPSATSMASQIDQLRLREGTHSVTGKRSMKFTNNNSNNNNNTYTSSVDGDAADADPGRSGSRADGPIGATQTVRHHQHHHIGRHGRNGVYPSLFDGESSPFPSVAQAQQQQPASHSKSPRHFIGNGFRHARHPGSRVHPNYRTINGISSTSSAAIAAGKKGDDMYGFDFDAEGADDERTPLVGSGRAPRSRHGRRPNSASLRQMEYLHQQRKRSCCTRYGICAMIVLLLVIMFAGGVSFILAVTKPLLQVQIVAVENVLASEQEIMLDLAVRASNPNLFPVAVDETDVNIFAKSRFVGTDRLWREVGGRPLSPSSFASQPRMERSQIRARLAHLAHSESTPTPIHTTDKVDKGTDPIPDPNHPQDPSGGGGGEPPTMLLGRVYHFDSPLIFEPSPWAHRTSQSTGQIRLARPGNKTEEGGTERWEKVIQHPFELIVRGVVKYQLPLTARVFSASVSSSVRVVPGEDEGGNGTISSTTRTKLTSLKRVDDAGGGGDDDDTWTWMSTWNRIWNITARR